MKKGSFRISFCVVCMNRLPHLKETFLQNLIDNRNYKQLEFILLDYNSGDGLEHWAKENLQSYISNERVVYYKTTQPKCFSHSHAKNLAFKLAKGDIVCNINADHYTGSEFAFYVNEKFVKDKNIVLTPIDFYKTSKNYHPPRDVLGKVCVRKEDFLKVKGFEEQMAGYGFEDYDFINRLEMAGVRRVLIEDFDFLKYIEHSEKRYNTNRALFRGIYVNYIKPSVSEVLCLRSDHTFQKCTLIDNTTDHSDRYAFAYLKRMYNFQITVEDPGLEKGVWYESEDGIQFYPSQGEKFVLYKLATDNFSELQHPRSGHYFYLISNTSIVEGILDFMCLVPNRYITEKNIKNKKIAGSKDNYGSAIVYKNFQSLPVFVA